MAREETLKGTWINLGRWVQPPLSGAFWAHWHEAKNNAQIIPPNPASGRFEPMIFLDGHTLIDEPQQERFKSFLEKHIDGGTLVEFIQHFEQVSKTCEDRHRALLDRADLADNEYVAELFDSYLEVVVPWSLSIFLAIQLERIINERGFADSDEDIVIRMRPFNRLTELEKQSKEIQEFARNADHLEFKERIRQHVEKFKWYGTHHWEGEGYTVEKALEDIARVNTDNNEDKSVREVSRIENPEIWQLLASFTYWRTHCAETTAEVVFRSRGKLEKLATRWGTSYADLTSLSYKEIFIALNSGKLALPENYEERKKGYGCFIDNGGIEHIIVGEELRKILDVLVKKAQAGTHEVKGTVASAGGIVIGTAKIVLSPRDFANFAEGDILVASETTPDFVPLMKKAKAIVTDTGGITSHAAIVSRELRKPCIVGTKYATQVFRDGNSIEMDTNTGVVRKL